MNDLIERLRDKTRLRAVHGLSGWVLSEEALLSEAADEIERLFAENERLRADLNGLVMLVARKYPGESRYETAARYIREIENAEAAPAIDAAREQT